ncbi:MAG: oxidoreductase [Mycobacterium sp.]|jgi:NAD(P)-dependent dehydrogenase (short-subunit alcohol dehydrogenase family)|uniref:oxidoreductase n=1 Tax=Mycobacterium sp. TaxID=1785 RepID=UPI003899D09D
MSVWFITGASRGFGAEIVEKALTAGHSVVATARDPHAVAARFPDAGDHLLPVALDVLDEAQAAAAVEAAVQRFGRIDVVVNNAGRGLLSAVEEASDNAARAVFDTNVFGILNVLRAVLPTLRAQRSGRIINLSSVGGFIGSAGWGIYCATKFAVEGFSEALAREVGPLGIDVVIVEPGYFRTDFLDASSLSTEGTVIDDYAETAGATRRHATDVNHAQPGDPVKAAAAIVEIGSAEGPPLRIQLGRDSFSLVADKLTFVAEEQQAWRDLSVSTDHDDVAV